MSRSARQFGFDFRCSFYAFPSERDAKSRKYAFLAENFEGVAALEALSAFVEVAAAAKSPTTDVDDSSVAATAAAAADDVDEVMEVTTKMLQHSLGGSDRDQRSLWC